ncbi:MAG: methyltransferase domain-containing protein [Sphingobacteriia bacterium]|nr:methyltransferase domain-containing protein [Sphingobacteriia bacterium]
MVQLYNKQMSTTYRYSSNTIASNDVFTSIKSPLISHQTKKFDESVIKKVKARIEEKPKLSISKEEAFMLVDELASFEFGKFLLQNQGLNGYWTSYAILNKTKSSNELENWLLNKAPVVLATRERFYNFRKALQALLKSNMLLASIPCGLMDDLFGLNYSNVQNISLFGIDLDDESIKYAKDNIKNYSLNNLNIYFLNKDVWNLNIYNKFDVVTSNGLNIYESDDNKIIRKYAEIYNSLKPGGHFVMSFLTPPPQLDSNSPWRNFNMDDLVKQKTLLAEIIETKWQNFRSEKKNREQLEVVGFIIEEIIYDSQCMFPTVIARK